MSLNEIVKTMQDAVNRQTDQAKPGGYDTTATVRRIEGDTAFVHIPGGVDETPVKLTINAKAGDNVQVRVSGGNAFLVGNGSSPPTDDARANQAYTVATVAEGAAENALANATRAREAADRAEGEAVRAGHAADTAEGHAQTALTNAGLAQTAAGNAQTSADSALVNLATTEDVVGVLNWITEHGTMTLTSDVTVNPAHVYFIVDPAGDYVVGGTHYSIVSDPKDADLSTYYELTVDESVENYVATHVAVDSEGLWLIPEDNATPASSGKKILIATGAGSTYTTAGTYIIEKVGGVDTVLASFTASGAQIGQSGQSNLQIDNHSMRLLDYNNNEFFYVSDLRTWQNVGGQTVLLADITESFTHDKNTSINVIYVSFNPYSVSTTTVTVNGSNVPVTSITPVPDGRYQIQLQSAYSYDDYVVVNYKTQSNSTKAYTVGSRLSGSNIGAYSYAEGYDTTASGHYSHAEGLNTAASDHYSHVEGRNSIASGQVSHAENGATASGMGSHAENYATASGQDSHAEGELSVASGICSHAEGNGTEASGNYSHSQNYGTKASSDNQTAMGRFNIEDNASTYAVIVGNGTSGTPSNALTVDWSGNVEAAGDVTDGAGTSIADLLEVQNTYGVLTDLTGNTTLTTSAKKLPLKTFSGNGCSLSSNGIKVTNAGTYLVSGTAYFHSGFTVNDIIHLQLYKNSTLLEDFGVRMTTVSPYENVTLSPYIVTLAANDVMYLYAYNQTAARGQVNTGATRNFLMLNRIA